MGAEAAAGEQRFAGRQPADADAEQLVGQGSVGRSSVMAETSMSTWRADMIDDKIDTRRETFMLRRESHG